MLGSTHRNKRKTLVYLVKTGSNGFDEKGMEKSLKLGVVVQPEFILDEIEKAIEKDKAVNFTGYFAKTMVTLNRISPSLCCKISTSF